LVNDHAIDRAVRTHAPAVLGGLVRRYGDFAACEDAMQEALVAALDQWPHDGIPQDPRGWLWTVARRRLIEQIRRDTARRAREDRVVAAQLDEPAATSARDDSLDLFLLCCHPALTRPAQVALTLRAVGGLTTAEIARSHVVPEATMAQRISRAKRTIAAHGGAFGELSDDEITERLDAVAMVLYLIFTEGHVATAGDTVGRVDLSSEAIRLTRLLHAARDDAEIGGLLALMLLTDARRTARTTPDGDLITLAEQDRTRWDTDEIREGVALVRQALATGRPGPYQLQAAIAAVHAEAADVDATDWTQILALYDLLATVAPGPMVAINRAVAVGEVHGPAAGLDAVAALLDDRPDLASHHRVLAVRGHLHAVAGDTTAAHSDFVAASRATLSLPEQRHLARRASALRTT
jgi:RNA polymerase sigma factor (sigma-70 family)